MNWNLAQLIASLVLLAITAGTGFTSHHTISDIVSDSLAPQWGLDKDMVRDQVAALFRDGSGRRAVARSIPMAIMTCLVAARCVAEWMAHSRRTRCRSSHSLE